MSVNFKALDQARVLAYETSLKVKSKGKELSERVSSFAQTFINHLKTTLSNIKQSCNDFMKSIKKIDSRLAIDITAPVLICGGIVGVAVSAATMNIPFLVMSIGITILGTAMMGMEYPQAQNI